MARLKVRKIVRSKRTIRRMKGTPYARKLAKLAIEARSLSKRLDYMVAEVQDTELTLRVYERALHDHGWDTGKLREVVETQLALEIDEPEPEPEGREDAGL